MKLIVGLGNPGTEYRDTRHNVGFMVVDALVERWRVSDQWREKFEALLIKTAVAGGDGQVILVKPLTFMNKSGDAVQALAGFYISSQRTSSSSPTMWRCRWDDCGRGVTAAPADITG